MACQMLAMALQVAAAGARPLRLQRFKSDIVSIGTSASYSRALLASLPQCLTELRVNAEECLPDWASHRALPSAGSSQLLARLTSLRKLCVTQGAQERILQPQALSPLTGLICLEVWAVMRQADLALVEGVVHGMSSLQQLSLNLDVVGGTIPAGQSPADVMEFEGLTSLTKLHLNLSAGLSGANLPPQLQDLSLRIDRLPAGCSPVTDMKLRDLQSLRNLWVFCAHQSLSELGDSLATLHRLTQVTSLDLRYKAIPDPMVDYESWTALPSITGLTIIHDDQDTWADFQGSEQQYLTAVQQLRRLTRLELTLTCMSSGWVPATVCCFLSGLTGLEHLSLYCVGGEIERQDFFKLCPLSKLTHLVLFKADESADDTVAVALASSMPELRHLDLSRCTVKGETAMAAFARLRHLTQLDLSGNACAAAQSAALIQDLQDPTWPKLVIRW